MKKGITCQLYHYKELEAGFHFVIRPIAGTEI